MEFVDSTISQMVNLSLSLSPSISMSVFRRALANVIDKSLHIRRGIPPKEYKEHQTACLDLFLGRGTLCEGRRNLLTSTLNGDWSSPRPKVWLPPDEEPPPRSATVTVVVQVVVVCCCGRNFTTYPRHRWVGVDVAVDEIGLLTSIHNLMTPIYKRFVEMSEGRALSQARGSVGQALAREEALPLEDGDAHGGGGEAAEEAGADGQPRSGDWVQVNARRRKLGLQLLDGCSC